MGEAKRRRDAAHRMIGGGHWTASRKAEVVVAIRKGELTREAAMAAHGISAEELDTWIERHAAHGEAGLMALRVQELRA